MKWYHRLHIILAIVGLCYIIWGKTNLNLLEGVFLTGFNIAMLFLYKSKGL